MPHPAFTAKAMRFLGTHDPEEAAALARWAETGFLEGRDRAAAVTVLPDGMLLSPQCAQTPGGQGAPAVFAVAVLGNLLAPLAKVEPASWQQAGPSSRLRLTTFRAPGAPGASGPAGCHTYSRNTEEGEGGNVRLVGLAAAGSVMLVCVMQLASSQAGLSSLPWALGAVASVLAAGALTLPKTSGR